MTKKLILASGSVIRAELLHAAGVPFEIAPPRVDEAAIKDLSRREGLSLRETAARLADAKALAVTEQSAVILGADQILEFEGAGYDKPHSIDDARARLRMLQGRLHTLINAISFARAGEVVFRHIEEPRLIMRPMTEAEIAAYLEEAGDGVLASVGGYQLEALGSRLFERIEGDYFAVLGLSLFPMLRYLRDEGMLTF